MRNLCAITVLLTLALPCLADEGKDGIAASDEATLLRFQITPTAKGIRRFLEPPPLTMSQQVSIGAWIEDLGSPRFNTRRLATRDLINTGPPVLPYVRKVANHPDLEVRRRANHILTTFKQRGLDRQSAVVAALRTVGREKFRSLTPLLLQLLPDLEPGAELRTATQTLNALVQPSDAPLLVEMLHSRESSDVRGLVARLLEKAAGAKSLPELRKLVNHPDENLRMAALENISRREPRECLPGLVKLLESGEMQTRVRAALLLRNITGQRHQFVAYGQKDERVVAVKRWTDWLTNEAPAATLQPLQTQAALQRGRILVCLLQPSRVIEFDEGGKQTFSTTVLKAPCGAAGLADGRRIFADWDAKAVITLDESGKGVARYPVPGTPNCLSLLPNGHILVGLFDKNLVYEIDADGKFVWQAGVKSGPTSVHRLPNGKTLVAMQDANRVVEIDRNGKETWSIQTTTPESARRLNSGNTLVASGRGLVYEYNRDGDVVWRSNAVNWPYDATELENGNILIGCRDGLIECDRRRQVIRKLTTGWVRRIAIY